MHNPTTSTKSSSSATSTSSNNNSSSSSSRRFGISSSSTTATLLLITLFGSSCWQPVQPCILMNCLNHRRTGSGGAGSNNNNRLPPEGVWPLTWPHSSSSTLDTTSRNNDSGTDAAAAANNSSSNSKADNQPPILILNPLMAYRDMKSPYLLSFIKDYAERTKSLRNSSAPVSEYMKPFLDAQQKAMWRQKFLNFLENYVHERPN